MASNIPKLIDKVSNLKAELKDVNADLKAEVMDTPIFKSILDSILEQPKVPEKVANTQAFKLALSVFTAKDE
jgi:uncharacterized protein (UPF0335 family)